MITSQHCVNGILAAVISATFAPADAIAKETKATPAHEKAKAAAKKPAAAAKPAGAATGGAAPAASTSNAK